MVCPKCGFQPAENSKFCSECGSYLLQAAPAQPKPFVYRESGRGAVIFVFGILGLIMFGPFLGIPAWVMGHTDLKKIREGIIPETEVGLTKAGYILGIIATLLWGIIILLVFFSIGIVIALFREAVRSGYHDVIYSSVDTVRNFLLV